MRSALLVPALVAGWGGILLGYDFAVIRMALPFIASDFRLNAIMEEWVFFSSLAGCMTGALLLGRRADFNGRRSLLRVLPLIYLVSAIGAGISNNLTLLIIFRFLAGVSLGGLSVVAPVYLTEISAPEFRGRMVAAFQFFIGAGILLGVFSDHLGMDYGGNNWRYMLILGAVPAFISIPIVFFIPQSPRWLMQKGQERVARFIINQVNPGIDRDNAINAIKESINIEVMAEHAYLFKPPFKKIVISGMVLGILNPLSGIIAIFHYAPGIFRSAGFSSDSFNMAFLSIGLTSIVFTIIAMGLIDKTGRRKMLMFGACCITLLLGLLTGISFSPSKNNEITALLMVGLTGFNVFSQGTIIWVLLSELFPYNIRTRAVSLSMFALFFFSLLAWYLIPRLEVSMGLGFVYLIHAVITAGSFFFYLRFPYEPTGKTLEEIEKEILQIKPGPHPDQ